MTYNAAIIGGGLVGLATAYKLLEAYPGTRVIVLEKEHDVGLHQSTHNSGVLHAGLHYAPGSLKARLARDGIREMVAFCREHGIAHDQCGKVVVATAPSEIARLRELQERGTRNGLTGLRWLSADELREREPEASGIAGLHVPEEGIVDYRAVCDVLRRQIEARGGQVATGTPARRIREVSAGWEIVTPARVVPAKTLINCAGLHSDRVARLGGAAPETKVVPFRGEYFTLTAARAHLVRHLIYPVPDPAFPFLGVHFTRMIRGGVEAGPNAVPALAREGYGWTKVDLRDLAETLAYPGLWRFVARYPRMAMYEVARSFSRELFLRSLQRLVPALRKEDIVKGPAGVRAQVMARDGSLVQDFQIVSRPRAIHVINAPSPAATASLAIGGHIADLASSL